MLYFICLMAGAAIGVIIAGAIGASVRADLTTSADASHQRAESLDRANGVLRRELAELRLTHEAPRDHGYGAAHG